MCVVCRESSAVPSAHSKLACDKLRSLAPLVRWVLGSLTSGVEWCSVRGRWVGCYAIRSRQTHSNQTRLRQTPLTRSARSLGAGCWALGSIVTNDTPICKQKVTIKQYPFGQFRRKSAISPLISVLYLCAWFGVATCRHPLLVVLDGVQALTHACIYIHD